MPSPGSSSCRSSARSWHAASGGGWPTARRLAAAYAALRATPREVCDQALSQAKRAAEWCWLISLDENDVRRQAEESTRRLREGRPRSPLEGVPIAIKDQVDVRGQQTTGGTAIPRDPAPRDAEAVARLRRAGAVIFGKTNLYELALGPTGRNPHFGDARNPWDFTRDTGGSSSGSAAIVAAGIVPLALGTDLGGSLRIPAALCGVSALKPTYGRVPTDGVWAAAPSLEHVGPIGASVDDVWLCFALLAQADGPLPPLPRPLRLGLCDAWWSRAHPETARIGRTAVERFLESARGSALRAITLPSIDRLREVGSLLGLVESAAAYPWAARARDALGPAARVPLAIGRAVSAGDVERVRRARVRLCAAIDAIFDDIHVLVLPTTATTAARYRPDGGEGELDEGMIADRVAFTLPFNLGGWPAAQLPCGVDRHGLPVGIQVIGRRGADLEVLAVASAFEQIAGR